MGERKAYPLNPKHQYHASQCGEHDCSANKKKKWDYYEYQTLSYFTGKL